MYQDDSATIRCVGSAYYFCLYDLYKMEIKFLCHNLREYLGLRYLSLLAVLDFLAQNSPLLAKLVGVNDHGSEKLVRKHLVEHRRGLGWLGCWNGTIKI